MVDTKTEQELASEVKEAANRLNGAIKEAAERGLRVSVDTIPVTMVGSGPVHIVDVEVTKPF